MSGWFVRILARVRGLFGQAKADRELSDEIEMHLELLAEQFVGRGMTRTEAVLAARRQFGNATLLKQRYRETRTLLWLATFWQDLRYTVRSARRAPLLSIVAIAALSLGIGLNGGVFTLLNALFLNPPTQTDPSRFVQVYPRYEGWFAGAGHYSSFTTDDYDAIRAHATTFEEAAAWTGSQAVLEEVHSSVPTQLVTCNYFHVFGIDRSLVGRFLTASECERGTAMQVAVLTESFWKNEFHGNPHIVGTTIHLNGLPFTVVGVAPTDLANFTSRGVYVPYTVDPLLDHGATNPLTDPDTPWLEVAGRLRPGFSRTNALAELTTILRQQDRAYLERKFTVFNRKTSVVLTNGSFIQNPVVQDTIAALMALILGPLSLVLLLACSNVALLFLSRAIVRRGEIAVRLALGISRARLLRMLALESFLTAAIAGLLSIVLAYRVPQIIMNAVNHNQAALVPLMHPNWHVVGYFAVLVFVATIVSSLAPMHAAWKLDLVSALKAREGATTMRSRTTGGLIVAQIAMTFVLLVAAVMFARMPGRVTAMDPGFEIRQTLSVPLTIDSSPQNRTRALNFHRALEARIRAIPGVESLAYETMTPFHPIAPSAIRLPRQANGQGEPATIDNVSTGFFSTFGIRMMAGRSFRPSDPASSNASSAAVVSQAFAKQFWPGENPIGNFLIGPDEKHYEVVGVAADTRSERFGVLDGPRLYTLRDPSAVDGELYVHFKGTASAVKKAIYDTVKHLDRTQETAPLTIWEQLESDAESVRSLARIIVVVALIAVLLAVTGVFGVLSFVVSQRTREFGVRLVLGANRVTIFRFVLLRGGRQIGVGLICGVALAVPAARAFAHLTRHSPYSIRGFDASVYVIAAGLLVAVSLAAMYVPALRATQVDPMDALRTE
jgi:predicted permease